MQIEQYRGDLPTLGRIIQMTMPGTPREVCEDLAEAELHNYFLLAELKPELKKCTKESILSSIKSTLIKGLSMDPNLGLTYVSSRYHNIGTKDKKEWIVRLEVKETINALLWRAQQQGKLLGWSQPEVEYTNVAKPVVSSVTWRYQTPTGEECNVMTTMDFKRLEAYSEREAKRGNPDGRANALYTAFNGGIDPGFAAAKCIKHSTVLRGLNPLAAIRRAADPAQYPQIEGAKSEVQDIQYHQDGHPEPSTEAVQTQNPAIAEAQKPATDFPTQEEPNNLW